MFDFSSGPTLDFSEVWEAWNSLWGHAWTAAAAFSDVPDHRWLFSRCSAPVICVLTPLWFAAALLINTPVEDREGAIIYGLFNPLPVLSC